MRRGYVFPDITVEISSGDDINPELQLFNSYDTTWPFIVILGAFRLICTNGLVIGKKFLYTTCKPSTVREYQDILNNHVWPVFDGSKISDITRGKVKEFLYGKLNDGYASSTVAHFRNCLSGVFNLAIDHKLIDTNPAHELRKLIKKKDCQEDVNPLTAAELRMFFETLKNHFSNEHYTLFLLLARTGMRLGEALALRWGDIDFHGRFIEIRRGYVRGRIQTTKSGKIRRVDMSLQLTEDLKVHRTESMKKGLSLGLGDFPEYVFTNKVGHLMDQGGLRTRVFKKALRKCGLREIRMHDLRHTYATLRIQAGHNIADVSKQLGHHSVKFTMDVYYHWTPGAKKSEVDELDKLGNDEKTPLPSAPNFLR
jgi:integrase